MQKWMNYLRIELMHMAELGYQNNRLYHVLSDKRGLQKQDIPASKQHYLEMLTSRKYVRPTTNFEGRIQEIEKQFGAMSLARENIWNSRFLTDLRQIILVKS